MSMDFVQNVLLLVGRILISGAFLWSATDKLMNWNTAAAYLKSKKVPNVTVILPVFVFLQIAGGLFLLFGFYTRLGAIFLIAFTAAKAYWTHNFWQVAEPEKSIQKKFFMKGVIVIGALLIILAVGGGHFAA